MKTLPPPSVSKVRHSSLPIVITNQLHLLLSQKYCIPTLCCPYLHTPHPTHSNTHMPHSTPPTPIPPTHTPRLPYPTPTHTQTPKHHPTTSNTHTPHSTPPTPIPQHTHTQTSIPHPKHTNPDSYTPHTQSIIPPPPTYTHTETPIHYTPHPRLSYPTPHTPRLPYITTYTHKLPYPSPPTPRLSYPTPTHPESHTPTQLNVRRRLPMMYSISPQSHNHRMHLLERLTFLPECKVRCANCGVADQSDCSCTCTKGWTDDYCTRTSQCRYVLINCYPICSTIVIVSQSVSRYYRNSYINILLICDRNGWPFAPTRVRKG